jgi:alkanesulfonate monooxygenase SsuD/methylene tetrahydromethanopterin reductase-like flavin-dependent oxidoreductase (luciferase family)
MRAAAEAGRPRPQIIVLVSVAVTDDADAVFAAAAKSLTAYDEIPAYQKNLANEGLSSVVELAAIGSAEAVTSKLKAYFDAGATSLALMPLETGGVGLERVWDVAAAL